MVCFEAVPSDIWREIVSEWLILEDLVHFDSAICNTSCRVDVLAHLNSRHQNVNDQAENANQSQLQVANAQGMESFDGSLRSQKKQVSVFRK